VTVRERAGLLAKGQPIDVDVGLPQLVLSDSALRCVRRSRNLREQHCRSRLLLVIEDQQQSVPWVSVQEAWVLGIGFVYAGRDRWWRDPRARDRSVGR
jgi:hypothetical protein